MLMSFISWWYGKGWVLKAEKTLDGIERSIDTFSLGLLLRTWFAPFRQIDAGGLVNASLEMRIRKFLDRLVSRFIGALLRTIVMLIGIFYITGKTIYGLFILLLWPLLPILPITFFVMFIIGWTPQILPKIKDNMEKMKQEKTIKVEQVQTKKKGWLFR